MCSLQNTILDDRFRFQLQYRWNTTEVRWIENVGRNRKTCLYREWIWQTYILLFIHFFSSRIGPKIEQVYNRNLVQDSQDVEDRKLFTNVERRKETTLKHEIIEYSTNQRRDHTRTREALHEDGHVDADEMSFRAEKQPSSRVRYCFT
jgi:hypothetical protein